jgi:hypothetical protein
MVERVVEKVLIKSERIDEIPALMGKACIFENGDDWRFGRHAGMN